MVSGSERRTYPRIDDRQVTLRVKSDVFESAISQSINISASGVYCKCDTEIPLMSRVQIMLMLPAAEGESKQFKKIETDGVVVREHPVIQEGKILHYDVAIFFDSLTERDRENIKDYIGNKT